MCSQVVRKLRTEIFTFILVYESSALLFTIQSLTLHYFPFFSRDVGRETNKITENLLPFFGICLNSTRKTVKKLNQRFGGYKTK